MLNIAIDGPSGAGKSTVAREIARRLGITYLDTGAMYRAVGLKVLEKGIEPSDAQRVEKLLADTTVEIVYCGGAQSVVLDGMDVGAKIRVHAVSKAASDVSKIPAVRIKLVEMQREIAAKQEVVLDGRDITSNVLPNAEFKFYLTATAEERARRRCAELLEKGQSVAYETVLKDINDRDYNDMNRAFAPLVRTKDSVYVDSTELTQEETVKKILSYIKTGDDKK